MFPIDGGRAWSVFIADEASQANAPDFSQKIMWLLQAEGKNMEVLHILFPAHEAPASTTQTLQFKSLPPMIFLWVVAHPCRRRTVRPLVGLSKAHGGGV